MLTSPKCLKPFCVRYVAATPSLSLLANRQRNTVCERDSTTTYYDTHTHTRQLDT